MRGTIHRDSPEEPDNQVDPSQYIQLLATDFGGIYQVYIAASDERLKMLRLAMSLLAAPFAAVIALVGAKVIDPASLTQWRHIPPYVFGLTVAFGLFGVLPYLRLIEATSRHLRTARAMNNFRLLYVRELHAHFEELGWTPILPVDPKYPETFAPMSGPGITVIGLALVDSAYIAVGMLGLSGAAPSPLATAGWLTLTALVLLSVYYIRSNVSRRRRLPENPFGFPYVES